MATSWDVAFFHCADGHRDHSASNPKESMDNGRTWDFRNPGTRRQIWQNASGASRRSGRAEGFRHRVRGGLSAGLHRERFHRDERPYLNGTLHCVRSRISQGRFLWPGCRCRGLVSANPEQGFESIGEILRRACRWPQSSSRAGTAHWGYGSWVPFMACHKMRLRVSSGHWSAFSNGRREET